MRMQICAVVCTLYSIAQQLWCWLAVVKFMLSDCAVQLLSCTARQVAPCYTMGHSFNDAQ